MRNRPIHGKPPRPVRYSIVGAFFSAAAFFFLPFSAGAQNPPDLAGLWETRHPRDSWGQVLVQLYPLEEGIRLKGVLYSAYDVSIWKKRDGGLRKLRDGLFGSFTRAALIPHGDGWDIAWYSPGSGRIETNRLVSLDPFSRMEIDPGDPSREAPSASLVYHGPASHPHASTDALPNLEGVYAYSHPSTGTATVYLKPEGKDTYTVWAVREVADLGYAIEKEGLFGESKRGDAYTKARVETSGGESWLVWSNPEHPGLDRRNRILYVHANGDLSLGSAPGDRRYEADSFLEKRAGGEARVDFPGVFLRLGGFYEIKGPALPKPVTALIAKTGLRAGTCPLFGIDTVTISGRAASRVHGGLYSGDPFRHLSVLEREGRCILRFYSLASRHTEELRVSEIGEDGSFALSSAFEEGGGVLLRARKLPQDPRDFLLFRLSAEAPGLVPSEDAPAPEYLLREIEALGPLEICREAHPRWTEGEMRLLLEGLRTAPEGLRRQRKILLSRSAETYRGTDDTLLSVRAGRRELLLSPWDADFPGTECREKARAPYLRRVFLHGLARLYYDELPREDRKRWEAFSLWRTSFPFPPRPGNLRENGYSAPYGMLSPAHDFAGFAEEFLVPTPYKDPWGYVRNRLPDKHRFFSEIFRMSPDALPPSPPRPPSESWVNPEEVESLQLIVTTPTSSSVASIAGHTLLLIKRKEDYRDGTDSLVLGFIGLTFTDQANGIRGFRYVWRGLTGHYPTGMETENLESVLRRARLTENRDVLRFSLDLSQEETRLFLERLWVLSHCFEGRYRFFTVNCASMLLDAINHVLPRGKKVPLDEAFAAPMLVVSRLAAADHLSGFVYPEYWSLGREARRATAENRDLERRILDLLPPGEKAQARKTFHAVSSREIGRLEPDPLFREPVLSIGAQGRAAAYEALAELITSRGHGTARTSDREICLLSLRFLDNAFEREIFDGIPEDIRESYTKADPIPGNTRQDYLARRVHRIRSRLDNNPAIMSLRRASSRIRTYTDDRYPEAEVYTLPRRAREERFADLARERKEASFSHGYFPQEIALGYVGRDGGGRLAVEYGTAVFKGPMGDTSVCTLKSDMRLNLLALTWSADFPTDGIVRPFGEALRLRIRTALLDFEKVLTPDRSSYSGFMNPGFGISLLADESVLWDGKRFFPGTESFLRAAEARFILNIFETRGFRTFLNLKLGAAWLCDTDKEGTTHGLGTPAAFEFKACPGGNDHKSIRLEGEWLPLWDFKDAPASRLSGSADIVFGLGSRTNASISARLLLGMEMRNAADRFEVRNRFLSCLLRFKW